MKEEWRDVKGFEGYYQVSNMGQVRSVDRVLTVTNKRGTTFERVQYGKVIIPSVSKKVGYKAIKMSRDGFYKNYTVHRLVAIAFIPNPNELEQVNHIDGNQLNNCINNLEWCTRSENALHAVRIGLKTDWGENSHRAKLTEKQAISAIKEYKKGNTSFIKLGKKYGVSEATIRAIVRGKNWKHLKDYL